MWWSSVRAACSVYRRWRDVGRKGDIVRAGQWALKATDADPDSSKAYHVLAMALERMGHLHKALVTYERAFELDPEDPELLINLGLAAWNYLRPIPAVAATGTLAPSETIAAMSPAQAR